MYQRKRKKNYLRHELTIDEIFLLLYVDDGALMFNNKEETIKGSKIAFQQMKILGLTMHVGVEKKNRRLKLYFFPSRSVVIDWVAKKIY